MSVKLKELEDFVKNHKFTKEPIKLDQATTINNQKQFAESHLQVLKSNSGNKIAIPYWNRLFKFYNIIKTKK